MNTWWRITWFALCISSSTRGGRVGGGVEWGEGRRNSGRNQAMRTSEGPRRLHLAKSNMAGVPKLQDLMSDDLR